MAHSLGSIDGLSTSLRARVLTGTKVAVRLVSLLTLISTSIDIVRLPPILLVVSPCVVVVRVVARLMVIIGAAQTTPRLEFSC